MKKKILISLIAAAVYFILLMYAPMAAGGAVILAGVISLVYIHKKSDRYRARNRVMKFLTNALIGLLIVVFGLGAVTFGSVPANNDVAAVNEESEIQKEAEDTDEGEKEDMAEDDKEEETSVEPQEASEEKPDVSGELKVHYIDVGQADSILIQQGGENMLIDAGNRDDEGTIRSYLTAQGVNEFKYVIGTHTHEDHIGSMAAIINSYKAGTVYFPKTTATTKTFENFVTAVKNKGMQLTPPSPGQSFNLGQAKCTILAPNSGSYDNANDYSIVVKVEFGNTSFLFDGDAEATSEMEMVKAGYNLKADVLKVGHHGSNTSTCANYLSAVSPKYAVISVGKGNSYGHPTQSVLDRLKNAGVQVFRTDENGTVVAVSDGESISFNTSPGSYNGASEGESTSSGSSSSGGITTDEPAPDDRTVYWTDGGKSYHYDKNCPTLKRSKNIRSGKGSQCPKKDPCNKCVK